jgi:putative ABC transport system permease protein
VARMVAVESLRLAAPGLLVGTAAALAAARAVGGMLVGVGAADPLTFGASALFLLAVSLLASYWPARRAVAIDPMNAIRRE